MNMTNSTAAVATSSSSSSAYHNQYQYQHHQPQSSGLKELNYINTEYVKDRNVFVSTASKASSKSYNGATLTPPKFNQKSSFSGSRSAGGGGGGGSSSVIRELNAKNRRNTKSYNPDNNKKSYLPFAKDKIIDGIHISKRDDSEKMANVGNRKMVSASFPATKSNLSYMTWNMDNQRISKRQTNHQNIKHGNGYGGGNSNTRTKYIGITNKKMDAKGSDGHKTNGDDIVNDMNTNAAMKLETDVALETIASDPLLSSTILSMITASSEASEFIHKPRNKYKNYNTVEIDDSGSLPIVAYLQSTATESKSATHNAILVNNHLNNNNVIVDSFESPPTAMELECVAGYDGGLPQYFVLEAYDSRTKKLRLNITSAFSDVPLFRIDLAGMFRFRFMAKRKKIISFIFIN